MLCELAVSVGTELKLSVPRVPGWLANDLPATLLLPHFKVHCVYVAVLLG